MKRFEAITIFAITVTLESACLSVHMNANCNTVIVRNKRQPIDATLAEGDEGSLLFIHKFGEMREM